MKGAGNKQNRKLEEFVLVSLIDMIACRKPCWAVSPGDQVLNSF